MTIPAALADRRNRLVAALYDQPGLRDRLSLAEITQAVDTAMAVAELPALLDGLVKAQALAAAVDADVATPPTSVADALGDTLPALDAINEGWGIFIPN